MEKYVKTSNKEEYDALCESRSKSVKQRSETFIELENKWITDKNLNDYYKILTDKDYSKAEKDVASQTINSLWAEFDNWRRIAFKEHNKNFELTPIPWFTVEV